jgi:hypothetical protein
MQLQDVITSALRGLEIIPSGETPSTEESADALLVANFIIDAWNGEPNAQVKHGLVPVTLSQQPSYTLGTRPVSITGAYAMNSAGVAQPVRVVTDAAEYAQIAMEPITVANWPRAIFCDYGYPSCTLYAAPLSLGTLYLSGKFAAFTTFTALTDVIAFPPGYLNLFRLELAVRLANDFGKAIPDSIGQQYQAALASVGNNNQSAKSGAPQAPPQAG